MVIRFRNGTEEAQRKKSRLRGGEPEAHFAAHLCATKWLKGSWPPQSGWPLETLWTAAYASFYLASTKLR